MKSTIGTLLQVTAILWIINGTASIALGLLDASFASIIKGVINLLLGCGVFQFGKWLKTKNNKNEKTNEKDENLEINEVFSAAIRDGDAATLRKLISSRAVSPHGRNRHGRGWLQYAVTVKSMTACGILLEYGASPDDKDDLGRSANEEAIYSADEQMIFFLKSHSRLQSNTSINNVFDALDENSASALGRVAKILSIQLLLCRSRPSYNAELQSKFVRGYIFGFFDAALQRLGLPHKSEEDAILRIIAGHSFVLCDKNIDVIQYVKDSIGLQDDSIYNAAHQKGVSDLFECLGSDARKPLGLVNYFMEQGEIFQ